MTAQIISLTAADVPQLVLLERECFSDPWSEKTLNDEFLYGARYIGAFDGDRLIGCAGASSVLDEGEIRNVAVLPEFRRQGIANALFERLLNGLGGLRVVHLEVRASNFAAIALYERFGFERVGLRRAYYFNPREDAILMSRIMSRENEHANGEIC